MADDFVGPCKVRFFDTVGMVFEAEATYGMVDGKPAIRLGDCKLPEDFGQLDRVEIEPITTT